MVFLTDLRGRVVRASGAAADLLNCPRHLLAGVPLAAFVDPSGMPSFRRVLRSARLGPDFEDAVLLVRPLRRRPLQVHVTVAQAGATPRPGMLCWALAARGATDAEDASEHLARHVGRELHDQAAQVLASVHLALEAMRPELEPALQQQVTNARRLLHHAEDQLRRTGRWLAAAELEDGDLRRALEAMASAGAPGAGVAVRVEGEAPRGLEPGAALQLYRIAQEAVSNAVRHGRARNVDLRLHTEGQWLSLTVRDDGRGFDPGSARGGLGLTSMRERAGLVGGRLRIASQPGAGTRIVATVPLPARPEGSAG